MYSRVLAHLPDDERPALTRLTVLCPPRCARRALTIHCVLLLAVLGLTVPGRFASLYFAPVTLTIVWATIIGALNIRRGWVRGYVQALTGLGASLVCWGWLHAHHDLRGLPSPVRWFSLLELVLVTIVVTAELAYCLRTRETLSKSAYQPRP